VLLVLLMKTHNKVSISLRQDLLSYIDKCVADHNNDPQNLYCPTDRSKMVHKAIALLMEQEAEQDQGNHPAKGSAGNVVLPSESCAGGSSIARIKTTLRAGMAK
jgi:metal-responsive CopG/Arc/MetJ family transcriptional regulator